MSAPEKITVRPPQGLPRELLERYLSRCRNELPRLAAAIEESDYKTLRVTGHNLKGTGRAYGFPEITETGAIIETAATQQRAAELREHLDRLAEYLSSVEVARD